MKSQFTNSPYSQRICAWDTLLSRNGKNFIKLEVSKLSNEGRKKLLEQQTWDKTADQEQ